MVPVYCSHRGAFEEDGEGPERYTCAGCAQFGYGACRRCILCGSRLHVSCAFHKDYITHPFLPGSKLLFLSSGEPNRRCDACGRDIDGYVYHCFDRGYDLHPTCAFLRDKIRVPETNTSLFLRKTMPSKCCSCGKIELDGGCRCFRGWGYESSDKEYCLHVSCTNDILMNLKVNGAAARPFPRDSLGREFFPGRVFMFQQSARPDRYCNACGRDVRGPCYHCSYNGYDLHPTCANLKRIIHPRGMEAPLVLRERMKSKCAMCGKKPKKRSKLLGYESKGKEYHVYCAMELQEAAGEDEEERGTSRTQKKLYRRYPAPKCDLVARLSSGKKDDGTFVKLMNIVKIAVTALISALVGDPTALIATFIAAVVTNN